MSIRTVRHARTTDESTCRFGDLTIHYDSRVLEPRSWTLAQSDWAVRLAARATAGPMLEVCSGAGQIGLAAAIRAGRDLVQVEADPVAADYARANAHANGWAAHTDVRNAAMQSALHAGEVFPVILADPPYLPTSDIARWPDDPIAAIDGGDDGLTLVRECLKVAAAHLGLGGHLLLQVAGPEQAQVATALAVQMPDFAVRSHETLVVDDERAVLLLTR